VVRLSRAEGQVLVSHSGSDVWEEAPVNLPLQEGDTLATQDGLAGIEFENGATGYLAENSVLQFSQLGFSGAGRATELTLTQGAGTFYANLAGQDTFRVRTPTFDVTIPERAEFRIDAFRDGAAAEVFTGNVSVSTAKGSTDLVKGQSVAIHQNNVQDMSIGSLPTAEDAFDQWVTEQGEIIRSGNKNTLTYINSPNAYGLSDLSIYGTWVNFAEFGGFVWRPFSVGLSWTPYFNGTWRLDPLLGWIWVSGEPWGWMPYHFGSWLLSPALGWVWVPGSPAGLRQWQAARVNWVRTGTQVGWVAMSPNDRDGVPANTAHGVITMPLRSAKGRNEQNEIVSGKELRSITPLKQPPLEFASHPAPGIPGPGSRSTIRLAPRTQEQNGSIVLDHQTHTFINREERNGNQPGIGSNPPVAPAVLMPRSSTQAEIPRTTRPPASSGAPRANRVPAVSSYLPAPPSRGNVPASGPSPARPPVNTLSNPQLRPIAPLPVAPQQAIPRPVAPPPAPGAQPRPAPAQTPQRSGSAARPPAPEPKTASPQHP
jgi:hypothetical protein